MYRMLRCQPCHLLTSRVDPQYSSRPPFFRWYSPLSAGCYFPNNYTAYFRCTGWHIIGLLQTGIGSLKLFENFRVASQSNVVLIKSLLCPTELILFWYNRPRWLNIQNSTVYGSTTVSSQHYVLRTILRMTQSTQCGVLLISIIARLTSGAPDTTCLVQDEMDSLKVSQNVCHHKVMGFQLSL